jgi:hypothetical protein
MMRSCAAGSKAWAAPAVALASFAFLGCFGPERHIVVKVRDPGAVALEFVPGDGSAHKEVLAGNGLAATGVVASGTFPTGGSSSASFELDADRLPDDSIRLRWVHPSIGGGEIDTILPPSGRIRLPGTDDVAGTIRLDAPVLSVPYSAYIVSTSDSDGNFEGYAAGTVATPVEPGATVAVRTRLETPWTNVVEIRRRVKPRRGLAIGVFVLNSVLWGVFGGVYIATAPGFGKGSSGETAFRAVGWSSIGVGGAIDLALLPAILWPSANDVVYPTK